MIIQYILFHIEFKHKLLSFRKINNKFYTIKFNHTQKKSFDSAESMRRPHIKEQEGIRQ